jgi:hypothetical protein
MTEALLAFFDRRAVMTEYFRMLPITRQSMARAVMMALPRAAALCLAGTGLNSIVNWWRLKA